MNKLYLNLFGCNSNNINKLVIFSTSSSSMICYYKIDIDQNKISSIGKSIELETSNIYVKGFIESESSITLHCQQKININSIDISNNLIKQSTIDLLKVSDLPIRKIEKTYLQSGSQVNEDYIVEQFHNLDLIQYESCGKIYFTISKAPQFDLHINKINIIPLPTNNYLYLHNKNFFCKQEVHLNLKKIMGLSKKNIINFMLLRYLKQSGSLNEFINTNKIDVSSLTNFDITKKNVEESIGGIRNIKLKVDKYNNSHIVAPIDSSMVVFDNEKLNIGCDGSNFNLQNVLDENYFMGKDKNNHSISFNIALQDLRRLYMPYTAYLYKIEKPKVCDDFEVLVFHFQNNYHSIESHPEQSLVSKIFGKTTNNTHVSQEKTLNFKLVFISPVNRATVVTTFDSDNLPKDGLLIEQGTDLGMVGLTVSNILLICNRPINLITNIKKYSYYGHNKKYYNMPTNIKALEHIGTIN